MSARDRIVAAAVAAGLHTTEDGLTRTVRFTSPTDNIIISHDSTGRLTGATRPVRFGSRFRTSMPASGLESRVLRWIGRHAAAPAPDRDDPFSGPEASAVASGMVLEDGPVTMIASGNAVVGSMVGRGGAHGFTRTAGDPAPGTVELDRIGAGFHLSVWGHGSVQVVALTRDQAEALARALSDHGITA